MVSKKLAIIISAVCVLLLIGLIIIERKYPQGGAYFIETLKNRG